MMESSSFRKIISSAEFKAINTFIAKCRPRTAPQLLGTEFPSIHEKTLWSIHNLYCQQKMKRTVGILNNPEKFQSRIYDRVIQLLEKPDSKRAMLDTADACDVAPSMVAKRFLEHVYLNKPIPDSVLPVNTNVSPLLLLNDLLTECQLSAEWSEVKQDSQSLMFTVTVTVADRQHTGSGRSKQAAKQQVAESVLKDRSMQSFGSSMTRRKIESYLTELEESRNTQLVNSHMIRRWMHEPHEIPDPILAKHVEMCITNDVFCGPIQDVIRQSIGSEYEYKLIKLATEKQLKYKRENELRKEGYDKTPDIKLDIPVAVDGQIVNWIESKASFADTASHDKYLSTQLWSYWNRFGPGLVIYWFGYLDDLEDNKGILVMDDFPKDILTIDLNRKPTF